ncbi:hypothetical protein [Streptomyces sp. NPDC050564]
MHPGVAPRRYGGSRSGGQAGAEVFTDARWVTAQAVDRAHYPI